MTTFTMNDLSKILARVVERFGSLSPRARLTAAALAALVVVSAVYLFNAGASDGEVYLFGGEPVAGGQLAQMEAAFAKAGLTEAVVEGDRIRVPRGQQAAYMGALADAGELPHNFGDTMRKMLENSSPFLISKEKQEQMAQFALQDELTKMISFMPGIEKAWVMYDVQQQSWPKPKRLITASVTVKPQGGQSLSREQVERIRHAVGPPIGAAPSDVAVIDFHGAAYPAGTTESAGGAGSDRYTTTKLDHERTYAQKLREALSYVPGAVVAVNVELHRELEETAHTVKIDAKSPADDSSDANDDPHAPAILHGARRTMLGGLNAPATIDLEHADGYDTRQVKMAGLTPKRVTVSVGVPSSYFEQVWRQRNGAMADSTKPDAAALAEIETEICDCVRQHVSQVVPLPEGQEGDTASLVTVTPFSQMPIPEAPQPADSDYVLAWLDAHSGLVAATFSCLIGLLVLRSIMRSAVRVESSQTEDAGEVVPLETAAVTDDVPQSSHRLRHRSRHATTLRDELAHIVRDDPDAAANVLRSWIGSAN